MSLTDEFREATRGRDEEVDLFGAAMLVARLGYPTLNPHAYAARLDHVAEAAANYAAGAREPEALAAAIDYQLFSVMGFTGNSDDYGNPENSFLNVVIDRRTGIPITLCLVYMEIAQRLGLPCEGVGYPGHFIVRCGPAESPFFVDPFHQGARLDRHELLSGLTSRSVGTTSVESYLLPVTRRQLLQRMLNNLRFAFRNTGETARWLEAVDLQLVLEPWNASLIGERGVLQYRLGNTDAALVDLQAYVETNEPEAISAGAARLLEQLRTNLESTEQPPREELS
jgi:regulator of sirC expression with transglutaminase-like and TPR domain